MNFSRKINNPAVYLLIIGLFSTVYILIAQLNVYKYILSSIFFELFWLPVILSLIVVPIAGLIFWIKTGYKIYSLNLLVLIISAINIFLLFLLN